MWYFLLNNYKTNWHVRGNNQNKSQTQFLKGNPKRNSQSKMHKRVFGLTKEWRGVEGGIGQK